MRSDALRVVRADQTLERAAMARLVNRQRDDALRLELASLREAIGELTAEVRRIGRPTDDDRLRQVARAPGSSQAESDSRAWIRRIAAAAGKRVSG